MFLKTSFVKYLTFGFAAAIALFPFVLVLKGVKLSKTLVRHERIHLAQQVEMLILPFYVFYMVEYFVKRISYRSHYLAYKNISFEREAYRNENDPQYLSNRRAYSWLRYIAAK